MSLRPLARHARARIRPSARASRWAVRRSIAAVTTSIVAPAGAIWPGGTVMISRTAMGTLLGCMSDVEVVTRPVGGVKRSKNSRSALMRIMAGAAWPGAAAMISMTAMGTLLNCLSAVDVVTRSLSGRMAAVSGVKASVSIMMIILSDSSWGGIEDSAAEEAFLSSCSRRGDGRERGLHARDAASKIAGLAEVALDVDETAVE